MQTLRWDLVPPFLAGMVAARVVVNAVVNSMR